MTHDDIVTRAAHAVREVMKRIQQAGAPPTAAQIREAFEGSLADESSSMEGIQAVVLDYVRRIKAADDEIDDLQSLAAVWSSGRVHLPITFDGFAAYERRHQVAKLRDLIDAAGSELPALPRTWAAVEALCESAVKVEPPVARIRAARAVRIARVLPQLDETRNLLAYALAHHAHSLYRSGDLVRAEALFEEMEAAASKIGAGPEWDDDLECYCPLALLMKASYVRSTRRLSLALDYQVMALSLIADLRTRPPRPKLLAISLLAIAQSLYEFGHSAPAFAVLQACQALKAYLDADLVVCLQNNLATAALDLGDLATAKDAFVSVAHARLDKEQARIEWTQARLALAEGRNKQGIFLLSQVRKKFLELGSRYDVGLLALELAEQHAAAGNVEAVQRFASEAVSLFSFPGCDREHLVAASFLSGVDGHQYS